MKVFIDEMRLVDDLIHIRYSGVGTNVSGRVVVPAAGFEEAWITLAIKRDLAQKKEEIAMFESISNAYIGKEIEIVEDET